MNELVKSYKGIILYLFFGICTTVVNVCVYFIWIYWLGAGTITGTIWAWIFAVIFAYITNRIWVFRSKTDGVLLEMAKFFSARIATLGLEMLLMYIFVTALGLNSDMWVVIWTLVTQAIVVISNYFLSKIFVFKSKKNK